MSMLDLEDVKRYLNIDDAGENAELQGFIDQAESSLAQKVGPLEPTPVTFRASPPVGGAMVVPVLPAIELTSVTPNVGDPFDVTILDLDNDSGVIWMRGASGRYGTNLWWHSAGPYTVVYQAGWDEVPSDLKLGAMELVRHLWDTQRRMVVQARGATRPSDIVAGGAFTYPFRVLELINPYVMQAI